MTYRPGTAGNSYPLPESTGCASCHVNNHVAPPAAGRWLSCSDCHAEDEWAPSSFGIADHGQVTVFPLDGAHLAVPCVACHVDPDQARPFPLALGSPGCAACHETDELHRVAYADFTCVSCHDTDDFTAADFGHPTDSVDSCVSCHASADPHDGQFGDVGCAQCHGVETFSIPDFDHSGARFVLDGAHREVTCSACHLPDPVDGIVRYRPLGTACEDCHGGGA